MIHITEKYLNFLFSNFITRKEDDPIIEVLNNVPDRYFIDSDIRMACFLAQCGVESAGLTKLEESLNYSAEGLIKTWPTRFNASNASLYARKPEKIANKVYASRMGNGDEASGDGWKFRGRGAIQITGKNNYTDLSHYLSLSLEECVKYCETTKGAIEASCWYWSKNNLNMYCDRNEFNALTQAINGGLTGLSDRLRLFNLAQKFQQLELVK